MIKVLVLKSDDYQSVYKVLRPVLAAYIEKVAAKKIMLKPNLLSGSDPTKAICTHPEFVSAIVKILEESERTVSVSDNPGVSGYGSSIREAKKAGLLDLIGDRFENPAKSAERVKVNSVYTDSFVVSSNILKSDYLINLPKFKTHSLTLFSGAIKNMFGILVGGEKARAHSIAPTHDEFGELLVDIYNIRPPNLTIMDAIWGMEGAGPSNGRRREIGTIIVSDNGFAIDIVCARMMGIKPEQIPYLKSAIKRGFIDPSSVEIVGDPEPLKNFKLPSTYLKANITGGSFINFVNGFIFENFLKGPARLKLKKESCTKCYVCVRQCPVGAMKKDTNDLPKIDKKLCIGCYCCDELCPEGAWRYSGIMRLIGGNKK